LFDVRGLFPIQQQTPAVFVLTLFDEEVNLGTEGGKYCDYLVQDFVVGFDQLK